jgi:hypothetical protein
VFDLLNNTLHMSHKVPNNIPLYSQYLESRIDSLEHRVQKLSNVFKMMLDLEDEEDDDEEDEEELF